MARGHSQQEVPELAATSNTTTTARRATCRPAPACSRRRCCGAIRADDIVCCYPDDLDKFIGPRTRVVAVSTHNPLGVTFAAGVYTSIFGSSKQPINSLYARADVRARSSRIRTASSFNVIVGGSGGWQISQTDAYEELGVDCVVEGRSESDETLDTVRQGDQR